MNHNRSRKTMVRMTARKHPGLLFSIPGLIAVALVMMWSGSRFVDAQSRTPLEQKVGPGVRELLQAEGEANVVIALVAPTTETSHPVDLAQVRQSVASLQTSVLSQLSATDYRNRVQYEAVPALAGTLTSEAGLAKLVAHPNVAKIDLDVGGQGGLATSVPLIGADDWHTRSISGEGIVVAVLDSGIDTDHSDLSDDLIHQECFLDDDGAINGAGLCPNGSDRQSGAGAAEDDAGHGTHVSGIITSKGSVSSVGVAPDAHIVAIKVTAGPSYSGVFYYFSELVAGLDFIINNRPDVQVINMSLGTNATFSGNCDSATSWTMAGAAAINTLRANGVVAFASSGNTGSGTDMTAPACLSNVIAVGATDNSDNVASFTSSNATTDIMAPGVGILSTDIGNGTFTASGTSMASPHAAGCATLLIESGAAVTPDQIETRLESSPVQVTDATNGLTFPRIDCAPRPPTDVTIDGPSAGLVDLAYPFTATTSPITATQPLTYVWRATGQAPVTHSDGLTDGITYTWSTPGVQTITVTVQNFGGIVTDTHTINLSAAPPTSVTIDGPSVGSVGLTHPFTATVAPITATQPLTYVWRATGQAPVTHSESLTDGITYAWSTPGMQTITVTAQNSAGIVTDTHTINISDEPPTGVTIDGPSAGSVGLTHPFTATVGPITVTQPLTYVWRATGQAPITHSEGLTDGITYAWSTPGMQTITVTAQNSAGIVTDTHTINISDEPPTSVTIDGPSAGLVSLTFPFTATVRPITATQPLTYVWVATGQAPVTHTNRLSDGITYAWNAPGTQAITVTATSAGATVTTTHLITINQGIFLPLIVK